MLLLYCTGINQATSRSWNLFSYGENGIIWYKDKRLKSHETGIPKEVLMGLFRKLFRTEHVYAGPEPIDKRQKTEYEMRDVYAGPEQMGIPEAMRNMPAGNDETAENEGTEENGNAVKSEGAEENMSESEENRAEQPDEGKRRPVRPAPPQNINIAEIRCVYAGPEIMGRMKAPAPAPVPVDGPPVYPLNNAVTDDSSNAMRNGFGVPDGYTVVTGMPVDDGSIGRGMASDGVPGSESNPNVPDRETIVCPVCGENTRHGKFCEYCGSVLK